MPPPKDISIRSAAPANAVGSQADAGAYAGTAKPTDIGARHIRSVRMWRPSQPEVAAAAAKPNRLEAPRLSLLGKPIYMSNHKCHYRNTASMRWKVRSRTFLEQPQGFFAWLYHCSLCVSI